MGFVLADAHGWLSTPKSGSSGTADSAPFDIIPLQTFAALRTAVSDRTADFFMWEHFTTKRYYDNGVLKRIGEIYTPWPSWHIVASTALFAPASGRMELDDFLKKLNLGVKYFEAHQEEAVEHISRTMDYEEDDAREWLSTVKFAENVRGVRKEVVEKTLRVLKKAGVLGEGADSHAVSKMVGIVRPA